MKSNQDPHLPPGVTARDIDGADERDDDGLTERERARAEAAEHDADCEKDDG